jgi:uncharacterized protein YegL
MKGDRIGSVNSGLPNIHQAIVSDPVISEKVRLGVISFSTEAQVDLPLSQLSNIAAMPAIVGNEGFIIEKKDVELLVRTIQKIPNDYSVEKMTRVRNKISVHYSEERRTKALLKAISEA